MKVKKLNYQRNGVAGVGFYQCEYSHEGEAGLIATFETTEDEKTVEYTRCRAIDPRDLNKAYRGDVIARELNNHFAPMLQDKSCLYDLIEIINNDKKIVVAHL